MPKSPARAVSSSFRDESDEAASAKVYLKNAATDPQIDALISAMEDMSTLRLRSFTTEVANVVSVLAGTGKRELKCLVRYHDSLTGDKFTLSIPGANGLLTLLPNSDFVDPDDARYVAFKAAFEACAATYYTDNTIVVDSVEVTRGLK